MLGLFILLSSAPGWGLFHSGNPVHVFSIQEFFLIPLFRASCSCFEHTVLVLCVGEKPLAGENLWSSQASGVRSCYGSVSWLLWKAPGWGVLTHSRTHVHIYSCTWTQACMHTGSVLGPERFYPMALITETVLTPKLSFWWISRPRTSIYPNAC